MSHSRKIFCKGPYHMHTITRIFLLILLGLVIAGCGGGSGGGDPFVGPDADAVNKVAAKLAIATAAEEMLSDGSTAVAVTAIVTDDKNIVVEGAKVNFSADSGALAVTQGTTNGSGQALAQLTTGGNSTERTITITVTIGKLSASTTIAVVDNLSGAAAGKIGLVISSPELSAD